MEDIHRHRFPEHLRTRAKSDQQLRGRSSSRSDQLKVPGLIDPARRKDQRHGGVGEDDLRWDEDETSDNRDIPTLTTTEATFNNDLRLRKEYYGLELASNVELLVDEGPG